MENKALYTFKSNGVVYNLLGVTVEGNQLILPSDFQLTAVQNHVTHPRFFYLPNYESITDIEQAMTNELSFIQAGDFIILKDTLTPAAAGVE